MMRCWSGWRRITRARIFCGWSKCSGRLAWRCSRRLCRSRLGRRSKVIANLLEVLREEELVENVAPIQLAIRLLIPAGSRLLELDEIRRGVGDFDEAALVYPWKHADRAGGSLVRADSGNRSFGRADEAQPRADFRANRGCGVCGCRRWHDSERFAGAGIAGGGAVLERALVLLSGADRGPVGSHCGGEEEDATGGYVCVMQL